MSLDRLLPLTFLEQGIAVRITTARIKLIHYLPAPCLEPTPPVCYGASLRSSPQLPVLCGRRAGTGARFDGRNPPHPSRRAGTRTDRAGRRPPPRDQIPRPP